MIIPEWFFKEEQELNKDEIKKTYKTKPVRQIVRANNKINVKD